MKLSVKFFDELTAGELYNIYRLRVSVFVVEQNCPYQEVDAIDPAAWHLSLLDGDEIVAYARVFRYGEDSAAIGRVISARRRAGYGSQILKAAVDFAKRTFLPKVITLEAQVYAKPFYEKQGFRQTSEPFLEDGIPHIRMNLPVSDTASGFTPEQE